MTTGDNKMTAIERLEELLNEKDSEIDTLRDQIAELQQIEIDAAWRWARHTKINVDDLPTPRLEIRLHYLNDFSYTWMYALVYKHFLGHSVHVPLGETQVSGSYRPGANPKDRMPFRDGVHIKYDMKHLGLRAFVIVDNQIEELETHE
jgi:hypothetical protein